MEFRTRNETINTTVTSPTELVWFVCECGDKTCVEPISLYAAEYEDVRSDATHFALAVNHENPETENVLSETTRFETVHKFYPPAQALARRTNPRRNL
jgi:hypothetical protein